MLSYCHSPCPTPTQTHACRAEPALSHMPTGNRPEHIHECDVAVSRVTCEPTHAACMMTRTHLVDGHARHPLARHDALAAELGHGRGHVDLHDACLRACTTPCLHEVRQALEQPQPVRASTSGGGGSACRTTRSTPPTQALFKQGAPPLSAAAHQPPQLRVSLCERLKPRLAHELPRVVALERELALGHLGGRALLFYCTYCSYSIEYERGIVSKAQGAGRSSPPQ